MAAQGEASAGVIQSPSLKSQVTQLLQSQIISGELQPDQIYSANAISVALGISTGPVREAFLTLTEQGLVEAVRNRGFRIIPLTEQDRIEIHEMRVLLEVPAMKKLAGHPDVVQRINHFRRLAHDTIRAAADKDLAGYLQADMAFHLELLAYCGNSRLVKQVETLRLHTRQQALARRIADEQMFDTAAEHLELLDSIERNTPERLEALMMRHLDYIHSDWEA